MLYQAKNGRINMNDTYMDFVVFGRGTRTLVVIPGVGDGLKTARGMALPFALLYRQYRKDYRVYIFSRKQKMRKGYTTRDMAVDLARAMKCLRIGKADVIGISQGGMVAQFLAADYPKLVNKLVLVVPTAKSGPRIKRRVAQWVNMVDKNRYEALMTDIVKRMYSERYFRRCGWLCPLAGKVLSSSSKERFCIIVRACASHDATKELEKIKAETLVLGAGKDRVVGITGTKKLARMLPKCEFVLYEKEEHGVYDEVGDFHDKVLAFLNRQR